MGKRVNIGGDRLGSGNKMPVDLHGYERSTHDLSNIMRTSMSVGTLVPFMKELVLPGDTWDIDLNCDIKTLPTLGPLFGSMKVQLDVFFADARLYQARLHNNELGIGLKMNTIKFTQYQIESADLDKNSAVPLEFQQINQSSILAYMGLRGVGKSQTDGDDVMKQFRADPMLAYYDIYKNYYANKQEEIGAVIHTSEPQYNKLLSWYLLMEDRETVFAGSTDNGFLSPEIPIYNETAANTVFSGQITVTEGAGDLENVIVENGSSLQFPITQIFNGCELIRKKGQPDVIKFWGSKQGMGDWNVVQFVNPIALDGKIGVSTFPLENIDKMRKNILAEVYQPTAYMITNESMIPYSWPLKRDVTTEFYPYAKYSQEGLLLKTYQSDIFNSWMQTEWIDGDNGISEITNVDVSDGYLKIDSLNLATKVYRMLNRIAISGGTYADYIEAVYDSRVYGMKETPEYLGGLSKELIFQEVVSTAEAGDSNPLGSLAGRGRLSDKHKGGSIRFKAEGRTGYLIGIVSITPRIDYSQGNDWDIDIKTMDDLHKPAMDEIGFQDLITEQMAFWDSKDSLKFSAGKVPAWLWYQTNINKNYGNFADPRAEMFMTLNRRYEPDEDVQIKDLTTYIDPKKFNYMFAKTSLDSQNYWTQIAMRKIVRRKMSGKLMPNL